MALLLNQCGNNGLRVRRDNEIPTLLCEWLENNASKHLLREFNKIKGATHILEHKIMYRHFEDGIVVHNSGNGVEYHHKNGNNQFLTSQIFRYHNSLTKAKIIY